MSCRARSAGCPDCYAREAIETCSVGGDHGPRCRPCDRSDDEVVGASRPAGSSDGDEQCRVGSGDIDAVVDDGKCVDQVVEECSAIGLASTGGELDADTEFGNGDRCDRRV